MVSKVVRIMPVHLQVNFKDSSSKGESIVTCSSEVFYIPQRFVGDFVDLVGLVGNYKIHYTVAVPLFFMSMDSPNNYDPVLNSAIYSKGLLSPDSSQSYSLQAPVLHPWNVSSESEFAKLMELMAPGDPLLMELI